MKTNDEDWIQERISEVSSVTVSGPPEIVTDTTDFMKIHRGQVLSVDGVYLIVTGNIYESRFGMGDEPMFWVKKAVDLATGSHRIVKLAYHEEFEVKIGQLKIRCRRDPAKEAKVLQLVNDHPGFMHGRSFFDERDNQVRVLEYIRGKSFRSFILELNLSHEEYFFDLCPAILGKLKECVASIRFLHDHGMCHGDIRSDHILIERESGNYRWIDFDLTQDYSDFDIWSIGNILQFCLGMGLGSFYHLRRSNIFPEEVKNSIGSDDALAFYRHRIANLQKLFPYIPDDLNDILLHFAANTTIFYESVEQILSDMEEALEGMPTPSRNK